MYDNFVIILDKGKPAPTYTDFSFLIPEQCSAYKFQRMLMKKFPEHAELIMDTTDSVENTLLMENSSELILIDDVNVLLSKLKSIVKFNKSYARSSRLPIADSKTNLLIDYRK